MEAMVTMRDALILIRLLAQMELLAPFSIEATTQGEILDFVAIWGDTLKVHVVLNSFPIGIQRLL
jgi:hypothetical protein